MAPLSRFAGRPALTLLVVAAACGGGSSADEAVRITDAWARPSPPGVTISAAYLRVRTATDDALVGVDVGPAVAAAAELHATTRSGGTSTMAPLGAVELPAGEDVSFEPGGDHVMLVDLAAPLVAGESFPLTLLLADAGPQSVDVAVGDGPP